RQSVSKYYISQWPWRYLQAYVCIISCMDGKQVEPNSLLKRVNRRTIKDKNNPGWFATPGLFLFMILFPQSCYGLFEFPHRGQLNNIPHQYLFRYLATANCQLSFLDLYILKTISSYHQNLNLWPCYFPGYQSCCQFS